VPSRGKEAIQVQRRGVLTWFILTAVLFSAVSAAAGGLLGKRYALLEFGALMPEDTGDVYGVGGAGVSLPISKSFDLGLSYSYAQIGTPMREIASIGAGVVFHPFPEWHHEPFFALLAASQSHLGYGKTDAAAAVSAGMEFVLSERIAIRPSAGASWVIPENGDAVDQADLDLDFNVWVTDRFFVEGDWGYSFGMHQADPGGGDAMLGLGFGF
jgi:hypothetical protein